MINSLNHIAIIVSCEEALDFYKKLGFKEFSREYKQDKKHTCLFFKDSNDITLELFIKEAPERNNTPETRGLRHICFDVDNVDEIENVLIGYQVQKRYTMSNGKRIIFIYDYDHQPIEFAEKGSISI